MSVQLAVLAVYFVGMIGMGVYWNKRAASSSEDFMLGGRSMGPLVTALTLQTTAMSGYMFMGGPAYAYEVGWFAVFYAVGDAGGGLVNLSLLGRRMRRMSQLLDAISPIEYLEKRFESIPVKVIATVISVFGLGGYVLGQFLAAGQTMVALFGFPLAIGLPIGAAVILIYTFIGGYFAVAWTDVIQGFIMIGALIGVLILSLVHVGGFTGLNTRLAAIDPTYLSIWGQGERYHGAIGMIAGSILIYLIGYMGLPHCVNKHMAMESPKAAKKSVVYATVWTQFFCFTPYILGLFGIILLPGLSGSDVELVIPKLADMMFPDVISAVVLTAIMSAIMSTVAALLLLIGTMISVDFYKRWINKDASDKKVVLLSRASIIIVGIVCIIIAIIQPPSIFGLVIFAFSTMAAAFLPSYFCAVWWKKANATGSCASMIVGAATAIVWTAKDLESTTSMHAFLAGLIPSIIAMIIGSQFGKPTSSEMKDLMDRCRGKRGDVSPKIHAAASSNLTSENKAVSQFVFGTRSLSGSAVKIDAIFGTNEIGAIC